MLNAGLTKLNALHDPIVLRLHNTDATDDALVYLVGLTNIVELHLAKLHHLRGLTLTGTKVTDAGVKSLQQALPDCKIER